MSLDSGKNCNYRYLPGKQLINPISVGIRDAAIIARKLGGGWGAITSPLPYLHWGRYPGELDTWKNHYERSAKRGGKFFLNPRSAGGGG